MKTLEKATINFNGLGRIHVSAPNSLSVTIDRVNCPKYFYSIPIPDKIFNQNACKKKKQIKK